MFITLKMILHTLLLPPGGPAACWRHSGRGCRGGARRARAAHRLGAADAALAALWLLATPVAASCSACSPSAARARSEPCRRTPRRSSSSPGASRSCIRSRVRRTRPAARRAARAHRLRRVPRAAHGLPVLVSGSARGDAGDARRLARDFGVGTRWVERQSRDTFQNAADSPRLLRALASRASSWSRAATHEWRAVQRVSSAGLDGRAGAGGVCGHRTAAASSCTCRARRRCGLDARRCTSSSGTGAPRVFRARAPAPAEPLEHVYRPRPP